MLHALTTELYSSLNRQDWFGTTGSHDLFFFSSLGGEGCPLYLMIILIIIHYLHCILLCNYLFRSLGGVAGVSLRLASLLCTAILSNVKWVEICLDLFECCDLLIFVWIHYLFSYQVCIFFIAGHTLEPYTQVYNFCNLYFFFYFNRSYHIYRIYFVQNSRLGLMHHQHLKWNLV